PFRRSGLAATAAGQDDLGHQVGAQAQLGGYFIGPETLFVVKQRQPLLLNAPRLAHRSLSGPLLRLRAPPRLLRRWRRALSGRGGGRGRCPECPSPLVVILPAGQVLLRRLIENQVLLGRLVHPDRDHGQPSRIFLLALGRHAIRVLRGPFGVQCGAAGYALLQCRYLTSRVESVTTSQKCSIFPRDRSSPQARGCRYGTL